LAQRFLDSQFYRVFPDGRITFGDDDRITADFGCFSGKTVDDIAVAGQFSISMR